MVAVGRLHTIHNASSESQMVVLVSILFIRLHGKKVVIWTVILEMQVASFPDPHAAFGCTKARCVNCRCSAVTVPIRSDSYATSSTTETVVSIQPPLSSTFFCLANVLSHMICDVINAAHAAALCVAPQSGHVYMYIDKESMGTHFE